MFDIRRTENNIIFLSGRLDAAQTDKAKQVFDQIETSHSVDFSELQYISSSGLGVLLSTQKRLIDLGHELKLINLQKHIGEIFRYAGFNHIFKIE